MRVDDDNSSYDSSHFAELAAKEEGHDIKFRTLTWKKATLLLFGEYVCLAILALPWCLSVLGWACGLIVLVALGFFCWYTSYTLWQWYMRHPESTDMVDIAASLFPRFPRLAREVTGFFLLVNNIMLIGFHVFTGAKILNTLSEHSMCTVAFQGFSAIMGIVFSLPRTLKDVSKMGVFSAVSMGIAILLALIFSGIEDHPLAGYGGKWPELGPVRTSGGFPTPKPDFVSGLNAVLNIAFLWNGQILYPSFIAEMKEPKDFPKALAALTALEMALFVVVSVVGYFYLGQYAQAPMIGSFVNPDYRKAAFAFVLPPTIIIGGIYSNVTSKYIYRRILGNSRHAHSNTVLGWGTWLFIVFLIWAIAFVLGNVIPSMGDFLSIISSSCTSWFGFIFWSVAYYRMNKNRLFKGPLKCFTTFLNMLILGFGLFMLGAGLYTSIEAIILDYQGPVRGTFSCADNQ